MYPGGGKNENAPPVRISISIIPGEHDSSWMWKYVPAIALSPKPCSTVNSIACTTPRAALASKHCSITEHRHASGSTVNTPSAAAKLRRLVGDECWHGCSQGTHRERMAARWPGQLHNALRLLEQQGGHVVDAVFLGLRDQLHAEQGGRQQECE